MQGKPDDNSSWPEASGKGGFLFAVASDPIFRWLHDSIIPRDPAAPHFLRLSLCAFADDFAVAASSFWSVMAVLSPAFVVVDRVAGLHLNHRKCCWVQYGSDGRHELWDWVSTNCEEFREMNCHMCQVRWYYDWTRGLPLPMDGTAGEVHPKSEENKLNFLEPRGATG